jgi:hypothetical protein
MFPSCPSTVFLCKTIGSRWREKIGQSNDRLDGTVLNVFERAINIKMDKNELLVLSLGRIPSPITINIASEQDPEQKRSGSYNSITEFVFPGDHVSVVKRRGSGSGDPNNNIAQISLGKVFIPVDTPDYFENNLQRIDENSLCSFSSYFEKLFFVLAECANSGKQGCLLNPDMTTRGLLPEFLAQIYNGANTVDIVKPEIEARLRNALLGLCGRGPGFTPAGDDFISGFITMFNSIRSGLNIGPAIIPGPEFARLTTWVSFKLIEYNAMGLVDLEIQELINSAAQGSVLLYVDKIKSLSKRGHTSGLDFCTGATFALCLAADSIIKDHSQNRNLSKLVSTGTLRER